MAAALLGVVSGALPVFLTASLAGQIDHSFPFSDAGLGIAVAAFHAIGAVVSPVVSRLLPRTGVRPTLWLGALMAAMASLAIALFARSGPELVGLLLVAGLSNGIAGPTASALLRAKIPPERHGLAFGTQQAGAPASLLLAGLAVPAVAVPFGWRFAFVGIAAVALCAGVAAPRVEGARPAVTSCGAGCNSDEMTSRRAGARRGRASRTTLLLLVLAAALASAVGVATVSFLVVYAIHVGISPSAAGLLLGCVSLAAVVGRITFGLRVDRRGADPLAIAVPLLLACSLGVTILVGGTPTTVIVGAIIMGGLGWTWHGVLTLAVVQRNQDDPVWAVGMLMSGVFIGAIVGPLLVGTLATQASFSAAWSACALISLVPLAAIGLARRHEARGDRELPIARAPRFTVRVVGAVTGRETSPRTADQAGLTRLADPDQGSNSGSGLVALGVAPGRLLPGRDVADEPPLR